MRLRMQRPMVRTLDTSIARPAPKMTDSIYSTPEFRRWRAIVIARAKGRCQARGCGKQDGRLFADHIVELKDGGAPFDPSNGQALCGSCHTRKTIAERATRQRRWEGGGGQKSGH